MELTTIVHNYIRNPFPLWECEVTKGLVQNKFNELEKYQLLNPNEYSTARCINDYSVPLGTRLSIFNNIDKGTVYLETFSDSLRDFYEEHGLYPYLDHDLESNAVLSKLKDAMAVFDLVKPSQGCVTNLVRSIQVLKQVDSEIDTSYSHPKIPFSIFLSVCDDNSNLSSLRVAESILHEAMHLKLTLIESVVQLVKPNTGNLFFSPWRDEKRPAQGILHGLFVFRAVHDFYLEIVSTYNDDKEIINFFEYRIKDIKQEIESLKDFYNNVDLTMAGKSLVIELIDL